ncbi:MAG: hypothetical protein ACOH2E_01760 [Candidatus Paracaedibacter sp.]
MKNYKTIKSLLLLSTLSICLHSNVSAREMDVDRATGDLDNSERKTTSKRTTSQADLGEDENASSKKPRLERDPLFLTEKPTAPKSIFKEVAYFPDDVIDNIIHFLNLV